jgi:hypothetical protein
MPAKLILHPPERAARFLIVRDGETLVVGREADCGLVVDDPRISKRHARLSWDELGWRLEDLQSKNGTSVNGRPASGARLADGDWVSFGGIMGRFQRIGEDEVRSLEAERLSRLDTSLDLRRRLGAELSPLDLLLRLLESAMQVAGAERGFVLVCGPDGALQAEVVAGFDASHLQEEGFAGSLGVLERALKTRRSVVLCDAQADPVLGRRASVVEMGLGALACVPLRRDDQTLGFIYVDSRRRGAVLTQIDVEILEALADHAALVLGGLRLDQRIRRLLGSAPGGGEQALLDELQWRLEAVTRAAAG